MAELKNIQFKVRQSVSENGMPTQTSVRNIGGTLTGDKVYQKYMTDVIAHALSRMNLNIDNERFTYTFPFHLR